MTHTSTKQPEVLRLADECEESANSWLHEIDTRLKSAKMLRAQHARIAELEAQLAAEQRVPLSDQLPRGFLSDVLTAAGLVSHGKQCKALGSRIGEAVEAIWKISIQQREAISAHGTTQEEQG